MSERSSGEVPARARRRTFTGAYKLKVLAEYEAAAPGKWGQGHFKSVKYCPAFPKTFASLGHARKFCAAFFVAYNNHHRHAGLGLLTPNVVHTGQAETVRAARAVVLNHAHALHTNRFNHPPRLPEPAWINQPDSSETEAHK